MKAFSIPKNIHFFENQRSNLSILASQGELAGTLLISQMPSGEGVLIREKATEAGRKHRAWGVEPTGCRGGWGEVREVDEERVWWMNWGEVSCCSDTHAM